jgi:hypothetical protein
MSPQVDTTSRLLEGSRIDRLFYSCSLAIAAQAHHSQTTAQLFIYTENK